MGKGYIVRRGGGGQQTVKPIYNSVTEVSFTSLTLSVTNDSNSIATLYYSVVNTDPAPAQAGTFATEFAGKETKDITITGLTGGTTYTVYIKAAAVGEFPSEIVIVPNLTTGVPLTATGGTLNTYTSGGKNYRSHTFTGNGTFQVTQLSNMSSTFNQVDYLIIAGGGGGGSSSGGNGGGGGGGAGGYRTTNGTSGRNSSAESKITVTAQSYSIVVGGGGSGVSGLNGANGGNSTALGITSTGGGGGSHGKGNGSANSGGSGGGGGYRGYSNVSNGGSGITAQGFNGAGVSSTSASGGGGGGAGSGGSLNTGSGGGVGGVGGNGLNNNLRTGNNELRARGGFGGDTPQATHPANTGSGGHGIYGSTTVGFSGHSGIVVIRYEIG
jgi:hypothetical protein